MAETLILAAPIEARDQPQQKADGRWIPYTMIAPAALLLIVLILVPATLVLATAFTDWQIGAGHANYTGLETFRTLLSEPDFRKAVVNTVQYVVIVVPATTVLGLFAAVLLMDVGPMARIYRAVLFMPTVATLAAMSIAWQMLLSPTVGALPQIMRLLHLAPNNWLQDPDLALTVLAVIGVWAELGFAMLFFLAGLKSIPPELHDTAVLDGIGGFFDRLWHVTLPHLVPMTIFVVFFETVHALRTFDTVAVITHGGPEKSTLLLLYFIYVEGFQLFRTNIAAAATVLFLLVVTAASLLQWRFAGREAQR
ncbi:carbohydrate ABC transporter permease [Rhodopseudomonas sp. B29]|uniref:carbohydrate ABC transporter permease n=1 Tax=Rhodopseudomonas sp. B29 TaxID=95607 RepID=UPI000349300C|nr:sugar ABC transporter permease [Rhodopseudomonas sp. B29]